MSPLFLLPAMTFLAQPTQFVRHDIDQYPGGYQVAVADVNGDGKLDVIALSTDGNCVDWYENPGWRRRPVARTERNIDLAPCDIDGDGRPEIALASGFYFADASRGGQIQWLKPGESFEEPWQIHPIAVDPVVHRLRWGDLDGDGWPELIHAPIFGPGSKGTKDPKPSHLWAFRLPAGVPQELWPTWQIDNTLTVLHGLYVGDIDGDGRDELLTASYEGIWRFDFEGRFGEGSWRTTHIAPGAPPISPAPGASRGTSEVIPLRLGKQPLGLAAVEPWHGNQVVVYLPTGGGKAYDRVLLDDELNEGHALLAADFDGDGLDEIVAGWRGAGGGLVLYDPADASGRTWNRHVLDQKIAVEGAVAADLNADGRLDLVVIAGRSKVLAWYENRGR